jgi:hypothetical protein
VGRVRVLNWKADNTMESHCLVTNFVHSTTKLKVL